MKTWHRQHTFVISLYLTLSMKLMPSLTSCACTISTASRSSFSRMRPDLPNTVTCEPNRCIHCASSRPMTPLPMTPNLGGSSVWLKKLAFVKNGTSCGSKEGRH